MQKKILPTLLICLGGMIYASQLIARGGPRPLSKSELLALVAGDIVPENVIYDIHSHGLAFVPDASYKLLLKSAGANDKVLAALGGAKINSGANTPAGDSSDVELLQHLSHAGALIKSGQLAEAGSELTAALSAGHKSEIGFVMGMVLIAQQRFPEVGQLYSQILADDPDFPEVHARLSLAYYQTGDPDEALRQAKAALDENPNNAVAHLNAAVSLQALQHFDAAKEEYRTIADRRVRLGLVLSEIGEKNKITVTDDEVSRAVIERARSMPGREKEVWDFYRNNANALAQLRAPIFEDKVVDFILELANVTEKKVSKEDLFKDEDEKSAA